MTVEEYSKLAEQYINDKPKNLLRDHDSPLVVWEQQLLSLAREIRRCLWKQHVREEALVIADRLEQVYQESWENNR